MSAPFSHDDVKISVVIAVRGGVDAKSRLRPVLGRAGCSALVGAMLGDMVSALRDCAAVARILLVTPTPELAASLDVEILADAPHGDLNAAFARASREVSGPILYLPGDLPELDAASVLALSERFAPGSVLIVPSVTDGGTGALLGDAIPPGLFAFGPNSLERHCETVRAALMTPVIVENAAFAQDVDSPPQLLRAAQYGGPRTRALLAEILPERQAA